MTKPLHVNDLRAIAQRRLTCAPVDCRCESECFKLAHALLQLLPEPLLDALNEPEDPDVIADYAPAHDWITS
jgi:hypothetical protein